MRTLAITAILLAGPALAAPRPVVLELFTSQSCSSCPPADALMAEFARRRSDVLPLDFHVDYWNRLSWRDPYSSSEATGRQQAYAQALGGEVFTPALVIDGSAEVVGSDRDAVEAAIGKAKAGAQAGPRVAITETAGHHVAIDLGAGQGHGRLLLVGYDPEHTTEIGAGENGGRTLQEANIVRSWRSIGVWDGQAAHLDAARGEGERCAVLLQDPSGRVMGAATPP